MCSPSLNVALPGLCAHARGPIAILVLSCWPQLTTLPSTTTTFITITSFCLPLVSLLASRCSSSSESK